jgi:hypothetical protein
LHAPLLVAVRWSARLTEDAREETVVPVACLWVELTVELKHGARLCVERVTEGDDDEDASRVL